MAIAIYCGIKTAPVSECFVLLCTWLRRRLRSDSLLRFSAPSVNSFLWFNDWSICDRKADRPSVPMHMQTPNAYGPTSRTYMRKTQYGSVNSQVHDGKEDNHEMEL